MPIWRALSLISTFAAGTPANKVAASGSSLDILGANQDAVVLSETVKINNPTDLILSATAPNYCFHDPLVGRFARASLPRYFILLHEKFARAGAVKRCDVAFILHGPMTGTHGRQFWREAPRLGLTGTSELVVGPHGIVAERVAYDLNLACGQLRHQL